MNLRKIILTFICISSLYSCADYSVKESIQMKEKKYYSSIGFALVYEDNLFYQKVVNKKINNENVIVMHNMLKMNTPVKIINPDNSKVVETKIYRKAIYPKIFSIVISKKIASILELDLNDPYVEIVEIKKNITFVAKKTEIFDEEKNVAEKAPVDKVKMHNLTTKKVNIKKSLSVEKKFTIVINDFYYKDSAINLKNELIKKTKINNIFVKKISNKKYRLLAGPFKNFNALKTTYISLNNLGFEDLNIHKD